MNHFIKEHSLQGLNRTNKGLLGVSFGLLALTIILSVSLVLREDKWVLIPTNNVGLHMAVSSKGYSETYLKEWAHYVMHTLMTTSPETVNEQVEEIKTISKTSEPLMQFFKKHISFVEGSKIQSVFFPKAVEINPEGVQVSGLFRYWLGASEKVVSQDKTYFLSYKRGAKGVLLLTGVKEVEG